MAQKPLTDVERCAHYHALSVQFQAWAEGETNEDARVGLLDMARQYDRLAAELATRIDAIPAKQV